MNSSISSSDAAAAWGRCVIAGLGTLALGAGLLFAVLIAVDPYDSGRFGWLGIEGVDDWTALTANASRGRDPQFDSAIIGNSTAQRLEPARLSASTGRHFVQLAAPGADPHGHLAILDFFIRNHRHIETLVIVADEPWCSNDPAPLPAKSFPFWLYGDSRLDYAARLFSWRGLDHAFQRIGLGLGLRRRYRPDGFFNYEDFFPPQRHPQITPRTDPAPAFTGTVDDVFPFEVLLDGVIRKLPADVAVVVITPPVFYAILPQPQTVEAAKWRACKAAFKSIVAGRPHSNFIDYRIDTALTRDAANFVDLIHYREKIARRIEDGIAASLRSGDAARIDF
jgi:hypothetical protein